MTERDTSVRRVLDVLSTLATDAAIAAGGLGVTQVASLVGKDKSQVSRSLKVLAEYGLIDRDPQTLRYRLGWKLHSMALRSGNQRLLAVSEPVLRELVSELDESIYISVLSGSEALTVLDREPTHAIQATSRVWPAYSTSVGRVLLSEFTDAQIRTHLEDAVIATQGPHGVSGIEELLAVIRRVRHDGFSLVRDEFEVGLTAVGVPIHDARGRIIAALGVSGPTFRLGPVADRAVERARAAAGRIDAELSSSGLEAIS